MRITPRQDSHGCACKIAWIQQLWRGCIIQQQQASRPYLEIQLLGAYQAQRSKEMVIQEGRPGSPQNLKNIKGHYDVYLYFTFYFFQYYYKYYQYNYKQYQYYYKYYRQQYKYYKQFQCKCGQQQYITFSFAVSFSVSFSVSFDASSFNFSSNNTNTNTDTDTNINNNYTEPLSKTFTNQVLKYISLPITISSMPSFLFLDDLYYYKFHRKYIPYQYPETTKFFMQKCSILQNLQINPYFFQNTYPFNDNSIQLQYNIQMLQYLQFDQHDPSQVYFLNSMEDIYVNKLIINTIMYTILKLMHLVLFLLRKKCYVFKNMYHVVKAQSQLWTMVVAMIEMNVIVLGYNCGLQFLVPSFGNFYNKLNMLCTVLVLLSLLLYCLTFYSLIHTYQSRGSANILIVYSKFLKKSFKLQPILILFRSSLKSFIHAYFIPDYPTQILLLFLTDLPFLVLCLYMMKYFRNKCIFTFMFIYLLGFTVFNLYFVLEYFTNFVQNVDRQLFGFINACVLALVSIFISICVLVTGVYDVCKKSIKKFMDNQIYPICQNNDNHHVQNFKSENSKPGQTIMRCNPSFNKFIKSKRKDQNNLRFRFKSVGTKHPQKFSSTVTGCQDRRKDNKVGTIDQHNVMKQGETIKARIKSKQKNKVDKNKVNLKVTVKQINYMTVDNFSSNNSQNSNSVGASVNPYQFNIKDKKPYQTSSPMKHKFILTTHNIQTQESLATVVKMTKLT